MPLGGMMKEPTDELPAPGVVLGTRDRRPVVARHWLLPAAPSKPQALTEWEEKGMAWLRPGLMFAAVMIPAGVIHSAFGLTSPEECAEPLATSLNGGPVFYQKGGFGPEATYTALLPAYVGREWGLTTTVAHPHHALILVPAPDRREPTEDGPWWVVPLRGPEQLCSPDRLAAVVNVGQRFINQETDA